MPIGHDVAMPHMSEGTGIQVPGKMGLRDDVDWYQVALVKERQGMLESDHVKDQSIWWKRMTGVEGNCVNVPESRVAPTVCLNQKQVTVN